jgi:hypothetical protein
MWLYFMDRFGLFEMTGALLDDYETQGEFPIDLTQPYAAVVGDMVAAVRGGAGSRGASRRSAYERCLGWRLPHGKIAKHAFAENFELLLEAMLSYYDDRKLASIAQWKGGPSASTLAEVSRLGDCIRKTFLSFDVGGVREATLSGITWVVGALAVLRDVRSDLGVPGVYKVPDQYLVAEYELLVNKRRSVATTSDRYTAHQSCASLGRTLMLTLQTVNLADVNEGGAVQTWLDTIAPQVESFATYYERIMEVNLRPERPTTDRLRTRRS